MERVRRFGPATHGGCPEQSKFALVFLLAFV
jgi:hypothetical protein